MRFIRHPRFKDLPKPEFTGEEHKDEARVKEFDDAFDRIAASLSDLYLVDTESGCGVQGAPISMSRHVDICRQHTIVVDRQAWHPDVIKVLHKQLQELPNGWTLAIDASEFPPGQAHITVEPDGTVHGWSDYSARATLSAFGFDDLKGPIRNLRFAAVGFVDDLRTKIELRRVIRRPFNVQDHRPKD
ncbi:hypothetical protein HNR46_004175 [Haloferula luteola]|uniref:Uncharacterized protein n=1 Tax=Haloferula luteola TaxID=595692 RepID=A0A840VJ69_9BACT|nr:hypothetical protein [Haloferula luteola]